MSAAYGERVRRYFRDPRHAGTVREAGAVEAYVEEGGSGARILLTAVTDGGRLRALRFLVFGCPHLVAAAERVCERFEGQPVESLAGFDPHELLAELAVPVEKTGRLLLLEDALRELERRCLAAEET